MKMTSLVLLAIAGFALGCPDEKGCRSCGTLPSCALCSDSFLNPGKQCQNLSKLIDNCEVYSSADQGATCELCVPGFFAADNNRVCRPCKDANCAACNSTGELCSACFGIYSVSSGTCAVGKDKKNENCFVSDVNGQCSRCMLGFALDASNRCVQAPVPCKRLAADRVSCALCHDGTYLSNVGTCLGKQKFLPYEYGYLNFFLYLVIGIAVLSMLGCCCCCFMCIKASRRRDGDYQDINNRV